MDAVFATQSFVDAALGRVCLGDGTGSFPDCSLFALVLLTEAGIGAAVELGFIDDDSHLDAVLGVADGINNERFDLVCLGNGQGGSPTCTPITSNSEATNDNALAEIGGPERSVDLVFDQTAPSFIDSNAESLVFIIVVENNDSNEAVDTNIIDMVTAPLDITSTSWTCSDSSSASCTANGTGSINDTVVIQVGLFADSFE